IIYDFENGISIRGSTNMERAKNLTDTISQVDLYQMSKNAQDSVKGLGLSDIVSLEMRLMDL
ncbi:hypothetical protein OAP35_04235, partial [Planktomarina temperata]|nr:hypothetical protein [Planktomarina temperata]